MPRITINLVYTTMTRAKRALFVPQGLTGAGLMVECCRYLLLIFITHYYSIYVHTTAWYCTVTLIHLTPVRRCKVLHRTVLCSVCPLADAWPEVTRLGIGYSWK